MLSKITPVLPGKSPQDVAMVLAKPNSYVYEQKLDGWRCIAYIDNGHARLATKKGLSHRGFSGIRSSSWP
jgi:ATP-dependent DNA ligase